MFPSFFFFFLSAFFCLSFSSRPLLFGILKPEILPPDEVLGAHIYIYNIYIYGYSPVWGPIVYMGFQAFFSHIFLHPRSPVKERLISGESTPKKESREKEKREKEREREREREKRKERKRRERERERGEREREREGEQRGRKKEREREHRETERQRERDRETERQREREIERER